MKDHIHTIPVLDALREPGHCPFCKMYDQLDNNAVDFIMGPAYMDEDIRDKTNEAGFCEEHLLKLYAVQNRLGVALLLHTHIQSLRKNKKSEPKSNPQKNGVWGRVPSAGWSGARVWGRAPRSVSKEPTQPRCYLCEKIQGTFDRYMDTFFYMWTRDKEIIGLVKELPGFCLPHYEMMMSLAENALGKHYEDFVNVVVPLQEAAMKKLDDDLDWFIQKFDYRNSDEPWKDSKDALIRALAMLKGIVVE